MHFINSFIPPLLTASLVIGNWHAATFLIIYNLGLISSKFNKLNSKFMIIKNGTTALLLECPSKEFKCFFVMSAAFNLSLYSLLLLATLANSPIE